MNSQHYIIYFPVKVSSHHLLRCQIKHYLHLIVPSEDQSSIGPWWPRLLSHISLSRASWNYLWILGWETHIVFKILPRLCKPSLSSFTGIVSSSNNWLSGTLITDMTLNMELKKMFLCFIKSYTDLVESPPKVIGHFSFSSNTYLLKKKNAEKILNKKIIHGHITKIPSGEK